MKIEFETSSGQSIVIEQIDDESEAKMTLREWDSSKRNWVYVTTSITEEDAYRIARAFGMVI